MGRLSVAGIVINRFGGLTPLARALGHKHASTVQGWQETGRIPPKQWPAIEKASFEAGYFDFTFTWLAQAHSDQQKFGEREEPAKKKIEAEAPV